jgi:hypothetical protein
MTREEAEKLIQTTAQKLGEHFDAVQIMVSWTENGATYCSKRGCGSWYARQGMAHEFIQQDIANDNARIMAEHMNRDEDDGEDDGEDDEEVEA